MKLCEERACGSMDGRGEHVPDNDWISRRWQGEGQVVRRDPARKGDPPVSASSEAQHVSSSLPCILQASV